MRCENTGLNRAIGGPRADRLFGGTGLDFLYGNGADTGADQLFRADGTLLENLDGGVTGLDDDWKALRAADQQGLVLRARPISTTRSTWTSSPSQDCSATITSSRAFTRNGDATTFDAQVQLDFQAQDQNGNFVWRPDDLVFDAEQRKHVPLSDLQRLLPRESDFLAIIVVHARRQRPGRGRTDGGEERLGRRGAGR